MYCDFQTKCEKRNMFVIKKRVCLPKTEQKLLIILSVSVLCFVRTTGPHDTFPHASPSHTLFCCIIYANG